MIWVPVIFGIVIMAIIFAGIWSIKTETRADKYQREEIRK